MGIIITSFVYLCIFAISNERRREGGHAERGVAPIFHPSSVIKGRVSRTEYFLKYQKFGKLENGCQVVG
jgi:hypothetical protein